MYANEDGCICEGNWRNIIKESAPKFGTLYRNTRDKEVYRFIGVMHCDDDYYYAMQDDMDRVKLLSCVGSIEMFGYEEIE